MKNKGCCSSIFGIIVILIILAVVFGGKGKTKKGEDTSSGSTKATTSSAENKTDSTQEKADVNNEELLSMLSSSKQVFENEKYKYIKPEDLGNHFEELIGQKIYLISKIGDFEENCIQINIDDGMFFTNFYTDNDYSSLLKVGDTIAIFGDVSEIEDHTLFKSKNLRKCQVFAIGEEAETFIKKKTAKSLRKLFKKSAPNDADKNAANVLSVDEYKASCVTIPYEDAMRNPDTYKNQLVTVTGTVNQIIEGLFDTYTIYIVDDNENKWSTSYKYKDGEPHLLENDYVKIYGKCTGTSNSTTILGKQVTLVDIDMEYVELLGKSEETDFSLYGTDTNTIDLG